MAFPARYQDLQKPITYEEMVEFLNDIDRLDYITVTEEANTVQGRFLYLVHLNRGGSQAAWKVFLIGEQHGNEPAGKDALLYLIKSYVDEPDLLPPGVDLWILPMANPDGATRNERRNGNNADLNRDHILLSQIETQTIHRLAREIQPQVTVDCHEFTRDTYDYWEKGWTEWPQIMMDCANHPFYDPAVLQAGQRWVEAMYPIMEQAGHNYCRYIVGTTPPQGELRYSTTEIDDARNGIAAYGGLSFIIESGVYRDAENPDADLAVRVDAYLHLLRGFIERDEYRAKDLDIVDRNRANRDLPPFLPINYFWGNWGPKVTDVPVISSSTGQVEQVPTANFMHDLIVKKSVATPLGYIIPADQKKPYQELMDRHDLEYSILSEKQTFTVEACELVRIENEFDEIYSRYDGRQIVQLQEVVKREFPAGSLYIPLDQKYARKAAIILEPNMLFGLYQYEEFLETLRWDGQIPVFRVME